MAALDTVLSVHHAVEEFEAKIGASVTSTGLLPLAHEVSAKPAHLRRALHPPRTFRRPYLPLEQADHRLNKRLVAHTAVLSAATASAKIIEAMARDGAQSGWRAYSLPFLVKHSAFLHDHKTVVCTLSASYISTFVGYPLDSLKARLQTTRGKGVSVPRLAAMVYREEGMAGFFRGFWIPLITISVVRAASFTIYTDTKEWLRSKQLFTRDHWLDAAAMGGVGGATAGALITFGTVPFELVKIRRQLEFSIAASKGVHLTVPPTSREAVTDILRSKGPLGLWQGFRIHMCRDTLGTSLYFMEYDAMRSLLGRNTYTLEQGATPTWLPIHASMIPFACGSLAGVTSWALIYPIDVVKTKVQQRALAKDPPRGVLETFQRMLRGPDPRNPNTFYEGLARIYRGLGVSALRSITTHGLLWTFFDMTSNFVDSLPRTGKELG